MKRNLKIQKIINTNIHDVIHTYYIHTQIHTYIHTYIPNKNTYIHAYMQHTYVTGSAKTSLMDQDFKIDFLSYLHRALN